MRLENGIIYPRSEVALRHGAGVEVEATSPAQAYASFPKWQGVRSSKRKGRGESPAFPDHLLA